ncbi:MAG: hypothetical protein RLZZ58_1233, partial [Pseudomonadota bacterium]
LGTPATALFSGGVAVTWVLTNGNHTLTGFAGATEVIGVTITDAGVYTVDLKAPIDNQNMTAEDALNLVVPVSVSDGITTTPSASGLVISIEDDSPVAVAPTAISLANQAGGDFLASLDPSLLNNYGGDGGTPRFAASLNGSNSGLTSNFNVITYNVSANGLVLTGIANGGTIFTITLLPGSNQYSVNLDGVVDSLTTLSFAGGGYQFTGGNTAWAAFVPTGQTPTAPIDDNSRDLLLTPSIGGVNAGTINGSSVAGGVGSGNAVDAGDMVRVDFVTDLRGDTAGPGGYGIAGNRDHIFDGHYVANGASALFTSSSGSTVRITAKDDPDGAGLNVVGDGTIDPISRIVIAYNGVSSAFIVPTAAPTNYIVNGITYTVTLNADGSVNVAGVQGTSGAGAIGTQIAVYTTTGYGSLEFAHAGGSDFKLGDFGVVVQNTQPVNFTVPVVVVDGDGDTSLAANLAITLTAPPVPPVVLDLDGDGAEFLSTAAGVLFDFNGDGVREGTAWAGADDGLLAIDRNGDGLITTGAELVFGGNGLTDLQGLAANYDSNGDGQLTAADADFASFGVWQDANSNGVTDAGEYHSLTDAGVTSISLTSDGKAYTAADGTVEVAGTGSYTLADGSVRTLADASFAIDGGASATDAALDHVASLDGGGSDMMSGLLALSAGLSGGDVAAQSLSPQAVLADVLDGGGVDKLLQAFVDQDGGLSGGSDTGSFDLASFLNQDVHGSDAIMFRQSVTEALHEMVAAG